MMDPAASTRTSPGTRSRIGTSSSLPARTAVQVVLIMARSFSAALLERISWT